jgi:hypothetical protein
MAKLVLDKSSDQVAKEKMKEHLENDFYHCDGCGITLPWDETNWFTSHIGFCNKCDQRLHKRIPSIILNTCYDECSSNNDEVAAFVIGMAQEKIIL